MKNIITIATAAFFLTNCSTTPTTEASVSDTVSINVTDTTSTNVTDTTVVDTVKVVELKLLK